MHIHHIAIWVDDLEKMRQFYEHYFHARSSQKYTNQNTKFSSYFLSFADTQTRIELMCSSDITNEPSNRGFMKGYAHLALAVGSFDQVNQLTETLRNAHYTIVSEPRTTGDGYYESVILDPEGNFIEITI
jgi:lactoylglutathione lyase